MRQAKTTKYRSIAVSADHPLTQKRAADGRGKAYEHRIVLYNKIGSGSHTCYWCKKTVSWNDADELRIVADHLDGNEWNNTPENLVASCWRCNFARARRPDFLTHCDYGHEWTEGNTYVRPDGGGRMCKECSKRRQQEKRTTNHRTRIKRYIDCPDCNCRVRVEENGKVCRHTVGIPSINKVNGIPFNICSAANRRVLERVVQ